MHQRVGQSVIVFLLLIAASAHRQLVHSLNNLHLSSSFSSVAALLQLFCSIGTPAVGGHAE
jgi:hypothetical protein